MDQARPRARVHVQLPDARIEHPLEAERTSVGSAEDCALSIQAEGIEPYHCVIQRDGEGGWEFFDLTFGSGTRRNGRVEEAGRLESGDQLRLGSVQLTFLESPAAAAESPPPPATAEERVLPLAPPPPRADATGDPETPASATAPHEGTRGRFSLAGLLSSARRKIKTSSPTGPNGGEQAAPGTEGKPTPVPSPPPSLSPSGPAEKTSAPADEASVAAGEAPSHHVDWGAAASTGLRRSTSWSVSFILHALILVVLSLVDTAKKREEVRITPILQQADAAEIVEPEELYEEQEALEEVEDPGLEEPELEVEPSLTEDEPLSLDDLPVETEAEPMDDAFSGIGDGGVSGDLKEWGRQGRGVRLGKGSFGRYAKRLRSSGLDIVFVIDSTASMTSVIDATRAQVSEMIDFLSDIVPNSRLGVVTYRDEGEDYVTRASALDDSVYRAVAFLDTLRAEGGGDIEEAVHSGVAEAVHCARWREGAVKMIVVIGDAAGHDEDDRELRSLLRSFVRRQGQVHAIFTPSSYFDPGDEHAAFFTRLARDGKGGYASLSQKDEVLQRILMVALGAGEPEAVQRALEAVRSPERAPVLRLKIARQDADGIERRLRKGRPNATFLRLLMAEVEGPSSRSRHPWLLPVLLTVLIDEGAPEANRWAVCVMLRRLTGHLADQGRVSRRVRSVAERLSPEMPIDRLVREAAGLRALLAAEGLLPGG